MLAICRSVRCFRVDDRVWGSNKGCSGDRCQKQLKLFLKEHPTEYVVAQVVGGVAGAGALYLIASGRADFSLAGGFASNGYGAHSPRCSLAVGPFSSSGCSGLRRW